MGMARCLAVVSDIRITAGNRNLIVANAKEIETPSTGGICNRVVPRTVDEMGCGDGRACCVVGFIQGYRACHLPTCVFKVNDNGGCTPIIFARTTSLYPKTINRTGDIAVKLHCDRVVNEG